MDRKDHHPPSVDTFMRRNYRRRKSISKLSLDTNGVENRTLKRAQSLIALPLGGTCNSTEISTSKYLVELTAHRSDNASRLVGCPLLPQVVNHTDVDSFTMAVMDKILKRLEYEFPCRKSIARVLAVMPINGELS